MWSYFVRVDTNEKDECVFFKAPPPYKFLNSYWLMLVLVLVLLLMLQLRSTIFHHSYSLETSVDVHFLMISPPKKNSSGETPEKLLFGGSNTHMT